MKKKIKTFIIILVLLLLLVVSSIIISYNYFKVYNPLAVLNGLSQVILFEKEYVQIQDYPKVIVANPNTLLEDFMQELGYTEAQIDDSMNLHDERLREFQVAEHQEYIIQIDHKHYSVWQWR